ncbi:MAG TPA: hypothetical protein VM166_14090 [Gemmatimonadaceae bacterium]|nr:hypothetical protein [Gemmatimonadaceae bacterium]
MTNGQLRRPVEREGFALAAALMALVLIAVMISGALFAASQETHASEAEMLEARAGAYAELAVLAKIDSWDADVCDALASGAVIIANPPADPPLESTVYITRLDSAVFLVVGEGRIASGGPSRVRRRIAIAVKIARDAQGARHALRVSEQAWAALYQM